MRDTKQCVRSTSLRQKNGCILDCKKILEDTQTVLSLGKLCEDHGYSIEWTNAQKNMSNHKVVFGYDAIRSTTYQSWSRAFRRLLRQAHQQLRHHYRRKVQVQHLFQHQFKIENAAEQVRSNQYNLSPDPTKNPKPKKKRTIEQVRSSRPSFSDKLEWLQDFRENLADDSVPERHETHASSFHYSSLEPLRRVTPGNHSVYTHFPKDRNSEICQRTKITRVPCRRRTGGAVPRAEHFGGLTTADHKMLTDGCESRSNARYAIVVQDLATQWTQSYPCKTRTSQETEKSPQKLLEPTRKPTVICSDDSLEFGKACEDLSWNHCTSTP